MRFLSRLPVFSLLLIVGGCVEHELVVDTEPQGALVYMNNQEIGRTPIRREFNWYGTYDVVVRMEGYETLRVRQPVIAPWWQWIPFDFVAEVLPFRMTDTQRLHYTLKPTTQAAADPQQMMRRAHDLEGKLHSGEFTTTKPVHTQPATRPAKSTSKPATRPSK
jgi:hypothetical protein